MLDVRGVIEVVADELLDLANGHVLGRDANRQCPLRFHVPQREQGAPVARLDPALSEQLLHLGRELQQADRVRDVRSRHAEPFGERLLLEAELLEELSEGLGELDRVEVLTMDVLDEGLAEGLRVVALPDHRGHGRETGELGGPQTPLAGDQLEAVPGLAHHDRLEDPYLADRHRQCLEGVVLEGGPRLTWVRSNRLHGDLEQPETLPLDRAGEQRRKPAT